MMVKRCCLRYTIVCRVGNTPTERMATARSLELGDWLINNSELYIDSVGKGLAPSE